jgi:spermidine synthase
MAAFLGISAGMSWGRGKDRFIDFFTPVLLLVLVVVHFLQVQIRIPMDEVIYFQGTRHDLLPVEPFYAIPLIFLMISVMFLLLSSPMGRLFDELEPLRAYRLTALGSIMGILVFTSLSCLNSPPFLWMLVFYGAFLSLYREGRVRIILQACLSVCVILSFSAMEKGSLWSAYYKITPFRQELDEGTQAYSIMVNAMGHQTLLPSRYVDRIPMYSEIYRHYNAERFRDILILGAGGGDDTAYHLSRSGAAIDAVEIDPLLMEFGRSLHPERPYCSSRVRCFVQDGRSFLRRTGRSYDCIIYALPDSLVLCSGYSNVRLESYLYTVESFREAEHHLKPGGILVIYNYFRKKWLIEKIASMLEEVFGYVPAVFIYPVDMACFITGPGSRELPRAFSYDRAPPATDDWPFLYLRKPSFPSIYAKMIFSILLVTLLFYYLFFQSAKNAMKPAFFFLGAAFMLLETRCIVTFSLLYGSTWFVNSMVFLVVLLLAVLAVMISERYAMRASLPLSLCLFIVLILNYVVPTRAFLGAPGVIQYVVAPLFYLLPIFFAGLVFTYNLKDSSEAAAAFASSTMGGILGGILEYASMVTGYNNLLIAVLILYLLAFYFFRRRSRGQTLIFTFF